MLIITIHLYSPQTEVYPLCVRTLLLSRLFLWKLAGCFLRSSLSFFFGFAFRIMCKVTFLLPSFFFSFAFWTMCPQSLKFMIWVFELQIFKLQTLLTKVHTIIDSTFLDSLFSTISGFDLHLNELIGMRLGLILRRSCMDLLNLGLEPICCAEFFWGRGLLLEISSSSPLSGSIELCTVDTPRPKVKSYAVFLQGNWAHVFVRSYFSLGQSFPSLGNLHQVRLGPWLRIRRPVRTTFLRSLIWWWSCRPKAPLGDRLPTFISGFQALSSCCAWLSCSQLRPTYWPEAAQPTIKLSWSGRRRRTPWIHRSRTVFYYLTQGVGDSVLIDDVLVDELLDLYGCDGHECFCFNPFSEVVDSHCCVLHTAYSFGKSAN